MNDFATTIPYFHLHSTNNNHDDKEDDEDDENDFFDEDSKNGKDDHRHHNNNNNNNNTTTTTTTEDEDEEDNDNDDIVNTIVQKTNVLGNVPNPTYPEAIIQRLPKEPTIQGLPGIPPNRNPLPPPQKGGRKTCTDLWDRIDVELQKDGKYEQKCKFCSYKLLSKQRQANRLALHLVQSCVNVSDSDRFDVWNSSTSKEVQEAGRARGFETRRLAEMTACSGNKRKGYHREGNRLNETKTDTQQDSDHGGLSGSGIERNNKGGRRRWKDLWDRIDVTLQKDGRYEQKCRFCSYTLLSKQRQTNRLALHLVQNCLHISEADRFEIWKVSSSKEVKEAGRARGLATRLAAEVSAKRKKRKGFQQEQADNENNDRGGPEHYKGGRKRAKDIWDRIDVKVQKDGRYEQKCKFCSYTLLSKQRQANRLAQHLVQSCLNVSESDRLEIWLSSTSRDVQNAGRARGFTTRLSGNMSACSTITNSLEQGSKSKKRKEFQQATDHCSKERAEKITESVAAFLTGCAIPIAVTESPFFIDMMKALNEPYQKHHLPKRKAMVETWLPKLYNSVNHQLHDMFLGAKSSYTTFGIDAYKVENGKKLYIITRSRLDKVMFDDLVEEADDVCDAEHISKLWDKKLTEIAGSEAEVETVFAAVTADNTGVNPAAGKILMRKYPKLFFNDCRSHSANLLVKEIAKVHEIQDMIEKAHFIVKFITSHDRVQARYHLLSNKNGGTMLRLFPDEDFKHADAMLQNLLGNEGINVGTLTEILKEEDWSTLVHGVNHDLVVQFEDLMNDPEVFVKMNTLWKLTTPLSTFLRHLEQSEARASWLLPAFGALEKDMSIWADDPQVEMVFMKETRDQVKHIFRKRLNGEGRLIGLNHPQFVLAMILDPFTTVEAETLPADWDIDCSKVLQKFYKGDELTRAETELNELISQDGKWGDDVATYRQRLQVLHVASRSHIETVAEHQSKTANLKPHHLWTLKYYKQFPLLKDIAVRLLTMATQSGDVERCCKVQMLMNRKDRNMQKNSTVMRLIFCYVNLRLLKKLNAQHDEGSFLDTGEDLMAAIENVDTISLSNGTENEQNNG